MPAYILTATVTVYVLNGAGLATDEVDEQASPDSVATSFAAADDAEARQVAARQLSAWRRDYGLGDVYDQRLVSHPTRRVVEVGR